MESSTLRPFVSRLSARVAPLPGQRLAALTPTCVEILDFALKPLERIEGEMPDPRHRMHPLGDGRLLFADARFGFLHVATLGGRIEKVDLGGQYAGRVLPMPSGFVAIVGDKLLVDRRGERRWIEVGGPACGLARCGDDVFVTAPSGSVLVGLDGEVRARTSVGGLSVPVGFAGGVLVPDGDEIAVLDGRNEIARLNLHAAADDLVPFQDGFLLASENAVSRWSGSGGRFEERWRFDATGPVRAPVPLGDRIVVGLCDGRDAWILDDGGATVAKLALAGPFDGAAAFGDGVAVASSGYDAVWWRPDAVVALEHDTTPGHLASADPSTLVASTSELLYAWRLDEQGPQVPPLDREGIPFDVPLVIDGAPVTVRAGGRWSLRGERPDGSYRPIRPGAPHRLPTSRDDGLAIMHALGDRVVDGLLPAALEKNAPDVWAALGQLPLRETLPLHARALFAPTTLDPAARERATTSRDTWFGELAQALGVSRRVALAAALAGRFPLEAPQPIEGFEYLGAFTTDGKLTVSDPCYRGQRDARFAVAVDAAQGKWHVFVRPGEGRDRDRTAELALVHENGFGLVAAEDAGSVAVDSGMAGAFDAAFPKRKKDDDELFDEGVVAGLGAVSWTGQGDGFYGVYVGRDSSGRVAKLRIPFLGPKPPQLDTTIPRKTAAARKYSPKERFSVGDAIEHPKFGAGTVIHVTDDGKIDVSFADGDRLLVQAR